MVPYPNGLSMPWILLRIYGLFFPLSQYFHLTDFVAGWLTSSCSVLAHFYMIFDTCTVGKDGHKLLDSIYNINTPKYLGKIPAIETLRQVWIQQYYLSSDGLIWRTEEHATPNSSNLINSPYDTDATYTKQGSSSWVGYKIHITESCVENCPNLITNVETTPATTFDGTMTPIIHRNLQEKTMLPKLHLADNGYVDADLLVKSQLDYSVTLLGPTRPDYRWQAQAGKGFQAGNFSIDWDKKLATCPEGKESSSWTPALDKGYKEVINTALKVIE